MPEAKGSGDQRGEEYAAVALLRGPRAAESPIDVVGHGVERPVRVVAQLRCLRVAETDRDCGTSTDMAAPQA